MIRRVVVLLGVVGVTLGLAMSQSGGAFVMEHEQQPCQERVRGGDMTLPWDGLGKYVKDGNSNGYEQKKKSRAELSNDAEQCNGTLYSEPKNEPDAYIYQKNENKNPQFTLVGNNYEYNKQKNNLWLDQSQNAPAAQLNVAGQSIADHGGAPGANAFHGGGGAPLSNDTDQENQHLKQKAENKPDAYLGQKNFNFNPQFTLVGNNSQTNYQGNNASVDQSQDAGATQGNLVGQSIQQG